MQRITSWLVCFESVTGIQGGWRRFKRIKGKKESEVFFILPVFFEFNIGRDFLTEYYFHRQGQLLESPLAPRRVVSLSSPPALSILKLEADRARLPRKRLVSTAAEKRRTPQTDVLRQCRRARWGHTFDAFGTKQRTETFFFLSKSSVQTSFCNRETGFYSCSDRRKEFIAEPKNYFHLWCSEESTSTKIHFTILFQWANRVKRQRHLWISFCHSAKLFTPHLLLLICESIYLSPTTSPSPPTICRIAFPCVWHYRLDWGHRHYLEIRVRWGPG